MSWPPLRDSKADVSSVSPSSEPKEPNTMNIVISMFIISWASSRKRSSFSCNSSGRLRQLSILVSGQLQLRTPFSRPVGVRLQELSA